MPDADAEDWDNDLCDLDPPPPWGPKLVGNLDRAARLRSSAELRVRSGSPMGDREAATFHRHLVIAIAVKAGMTQEAVAGVFDISQPAVSYICRKIDEAANPGDPAR